MPAGLLIVKLVIALGVWYVVATPTIVGRVIAGGDHVPALNATSSPPSTVAEESNVAVTVPVGPAEVRYSYPMMAPVLALALPEGEVLYPLKAVSKLVAVGEVVLAEFCWWMPASSSVVGFIVVMPVDIRLYSYRETETNQPKEFLLPTREKALHQISTVNPRPDNPDYSVVCSSYNQRNIIKII